MITVVTAANSRNLTTAAAVKALLGLDAPDDAVLDALVVAASATVEAHCHRTFAREVLTETVKGYGGTVLMLGRAPIARVTSVMGDGGAVISDYVVENPGAGMLYRKRGWLDTSEVGWNIVENRVPGSEEPLYTVAYAAGWLLPGDRVESEGANWSVVGGQFVLAVAGGSFPLTFAAGDKVYVDGFATAANNGWFTVASVAAQALTPVETTLVAEVPSEGVRSVDIVDPNGRRSLWALPADVQHAATETVRTLYLGRKAAGDVQSKQVGDLSITYRQRSDADATGLPFEAIGRLTPYVRLA